MANIGYVLKGRFFPPSPVTKSFAGKTVIVNGSNTGLGYEVALKFVELDAETVIIAVRSLAKGLAAKERIEQKTKRTNVIQVWELDMGNFASVDAFARKVDDSLPKLDIAVLNAGLFAAKYEPSSEGWEKMLQVNTLSTTLLAILLLPKLKASSTPSSPSHLEVVSSKGHADSQLRLVKDPRERLHDANDAKNFASYQQYVQSKLFVMWTMRELGQTCLGPDGQPLVIINDTCPGACRSDVTRDFRSPLVNIILPIVSFLLFRPAEQGARTLVKVTAMGKESHGKFVITDDITPESHHITSQEGKVMQKAMWDEVLDVLGQKVPRVQAMV